MASGKHVHKLEGFPRRLQIRQMLLDGYTMKPEEFKVSEHYGVYQTISAWFEKMEKKYETSSGEEKEVVDNMYSEACSLCGQGARRVRAKLDLESMKGINGSADAPHWSFQIPPMVFEARAFGEEGAAAVFKELERSTFLKRVSFRNPPANVLSHVNRPDKPSKDRESDTYHIRVAALKLRDGAQEIVDEMATMVVNSGTQLTAMRKLHAASVDRQKWSQTTQLKEHCWPEEENGGSTGFAVGAGKYEGLGAVKQQDDLDLFTAGDGRIVAGESPSMLLDPASEISGMSACGIEAMRAMDGSDIIETPSGVRMKLLVVNGQPLSGLLGSNFLRCWDEPWWSLDGLNRGACDGVMAVAGDSVYAVFQGSRNDSLSEDRAERMADLMRHTAARDLLYHWATRAGFQPEREKPGLLLPQRPDEHHLGRRRPADLFVASYLGSPTAFDLAFTAPQRQEALGTASRQALATGTAYAGTKMAHLQTAELCRSQRIHFTPLVAETTGAWEPHSAAFLKRVARAVAAREGSDAAQLEGQLLQELSVTARAYRARAVLHRRAEAAFA
ncbi:unnamed protein product [Durusdinium trenchii]|uniref:Uncharacterized protein n=1 Tax=Durusdinium trenchii TaxID=1381693 RepID=A0ABP0R2W9_9DINO